MVHVLQTMQNLVISRCCFAEDGKEMYQDSKRTCTAIVLLINPFVLMTFPLPLPSWFRKLPNVRGQISEHIFAPNGDYGLFIPWSTKIASVCVTFWAFFYCSPSFLYFGGVINKTIIPLALVRYEMIIANSALRLSIISYPTRAHGIIVKYPDSMYTWYRAVERTPLIFYFFLFRSFAKVFKYTQSGPSLKL